MDATWITMDGKPAVELLADGHTYQVCTLTGPEVLELARQYYERNGAAEKVRHRQSGGCSMTRHGVSVALDMLSLTAILSPPGKCERCGGADDGD